MMTDGFYVVATALVACVLAEGLSYLLIYRTERYQNLKTSIETLHNNLEAKKVKANSKKEKNMKSQLKEKQRDISFLKIKSTVVNVLILAGVWKFLGGLFGGMYRTPKHFSLSYNCTSHFVLFMLILILCML